MSEILKQILNERAPTETVKMADIIVGFLTKEVDVAEMRAKRGADFDSTSFYQIRVKPNDKEADLESILTKIQKALKGKAAKSMNIKDVQINPTSRNSGKYSSVSFSIAGSDYDIVVAKGGNAGENFEKDMLLKMDNLLVGEDDEQAKKAFEALAKVDPAFKMSNIKSVAARSGSTQRSGDMTPEETGKIIADIIITLKKGGDKYISLKNKNGSTVAQFGISKAFTDDLKINKTSPEWKSWLEPFSLDPKKIEQGLQAAANGTDVSWDDVDLADKKVKKDSGIHKIMQKMWGANYYYLREKGDGFIAMKMDKDYVDNELLKNLHVTEIRYPCAARKQINIYISSDTKNFKLEVRNPRGKGSVKPTQIQLTVLKDK